MINNVAIVLLFLLISLHFKEDLSMIYFIPFLVLILIYINTSRYEHFFLCQLENKVLNSFGGDSYFGKFKSKVKENLLKINKNTETLILKI